MKCKDIMTQNPTCCAPSETIEEAARHMKEEDIGSVLVCDSPQSHHLIGILTDRDIVIKVIAEGQDPKNIPVQRIMTPDPLTCHEEENLQHAMDLMEEHQIRRIPILNEHNQFVGIVSQGDLAKRFGNQQRTGQMVEEISKSPEEHGRGIS